MGVYVEFFQSLRNAKKNNANYNVFWGNIMNFNQIVTGRSSYYFFVGYYTALCALILQSGVKTTFYINILSNIRESPFVSLIASVPFIYILGIMIETMKGIIKTHLLKSTIYQSENLPKPAINSLNTIAETELNLNKNIGFDVKLLSVKQFLLPDFDSYKIQHRWLHDFLENIILMSLMSLFIVSCRFIAFSWDNLDWIVFVSSICISIMSFARLSELKVSYTSIELGFVLQEYSLQVQNDIKTNQLIFLTKC